MSMKRVREQYDVPAFQHRGVRFQGQPAYILSAARTGMYLYLRRHSDGARLMVHPTWEMDYLDGKGTR
jgi:hypothetical protein